VREEPVQAPQHQPEPEEQYYGERPKGGNSITERFRNLWGKIIEATDEKLDDTLN